MRLSALGAPLFSSGTRWLQAHGSGRRRQAGLPAWAGSVPVRHGGSAGVPKRSGVRQQVLERERLENLRQCGRRRSWRPRAASRWSTVITSSSASLPTCADSVPAPTACCYRLPLTADRAQKSTHAVVSIGRAVVFFWSVLASGARERTETAGWSAGLGRFGARQAWRISGSAEAKRIQTAGTEARASGEPQAVWSPA